MADEDDKLTIQTERDADENEGNEGCGYNSARGSTSLPDAPGRGVGAELAETVEQSVDKLVNKVKDAVHLGDGKP